jgi:hypothetical protein
LEGSTLNGKSLTIKSTVAVMGFDIAHDKRLTETVAMSEN